MQPTYFRCYPWDLEDEGTDLAIGRMAGEIGVDAVSVAVVLPAVRAFRGRAAGGPRTILREAAAHFQRSAGCYGHTRLRPPAAAWMKSRNPLERIARACETHALRLRARAVCCDNEALAARHPMAGCVDVFGDPIGASLCPSNADVREYAAALAEDLSGHYPLDALELEAADFSPCVTRRDRYETGVDLGPVGRALAGWCFCPACRQRAGAADIDAEAVDRRVRGVLEPLFRLEAGPIASFDDLAAGHAELAAYHRMRREAVGSLVAGVRRRTEGRLLVVLTHEAWISGADVAMLGEACDGFILPPGGVAGCGPERAEPPAVARAAPERLEVVLHCHPPHCADGPALVTRVRRASQRGYGGIGFSDYGLAPEPCLDWVRQAIRYARRESDA